jgi:hypothetical protein
LTSRLSRFQREVLDAFFARERRFYLTGGAALAGFHLGHRATLDLDFFTLEDALDPGVHALADAARAIGASGEAVLTSPDFRRFLLRRGEDSVLVDLVRERVHQLRPDKPAFGTIRVDPPEEIFANKLCALLARAEIRDLVDLRALELAGCALDAGLDAGARKDGGLTPNQLAWVLSDVEIPDDARVPGVDPATLRAYLADLIDRLVRLGAAGQP